MSTVLIKLNNFLVTTSFLEEDKRDYLLSQRSIVLKEKHVQMTWFLIIQNSNEIECVRTKANYENKREKYRKKMCGF